MRSPTTGPTPIVARVARRYGQRGLRAAAVAGATIWVGQPGCSGAAQEEPAGRQPDAATALDPRIEALDRGRQLYEGNCASCHGVGAVGDGPMAASLPVPPAKILEHLGDHGYEDMVKMVVDGIPPAMPPAVLGSDDVRLVLNYVWTLVGFVESHRRRGTGWLLVRPPLNKRLGQTARRGSRSAGHRIVPESVT